MTDAQTEQLGDGVARLLDEVGVLCENEEILLALEAIGARVDLAASRATFPPRAVRAFVEGLREEAGGAARPWDRTFTKPEPATLDGQIAQHYHDARDWNTRPGCRSDAVLLAKLASGLHPDQHAGHALTLTDVPAPLEPLESCALLAEWAHNPGRCFAWTVEQVDWLREMGEIMGRPDWFFWGAICFAHPFRFDRVPAAKFVRRVREGVPTGLTAMPVAGATAPVTLAGFVVSAAAEHIATWMAARALNPSVGLGGSMWAGTIDARTGAVSYSATDAMSYAVATVAFLRLWAGVRIAVGAGDYCDAREPGLYAALEKAYKSMTVTACTGQPWAAGTGLLDEGRTISPVQLLLDRELSGSAAWLARGFDVEAVEAGVQAAVEIGLGFGSNHLASGHTARHFRNSLWLPRYADRRGWTREADEAAVRRAQADIDRMVAEYRKPADRDGVLGRVRGVIDRARRVLL